MTPPLPENLWFPVAPGITELPEAPAVETATYVPGNAIPTPPGFNPNSPGDIWASLPVGQEPTYAKSLTPDALVPTYRETLKSLGLIKVRMSARRYDYSLVPREATVVLAVDALCTAQSIPTLGAASGSITLVGLDAELTVTAEPSTLALSLGISLTPEIVRYEPPLIVFGHSAPTNTGGSYLTLARVYPNSVTNITNSLSNQPASRIVDVVMSPDGGRLIYLVRNSPWLGWYSVTNYTFTSQGTTPQQPTSFGQAAFSPRGQHLFIEDQYQTPYYSLFRTTASGFSLITNALDVAPTSRIKGFEYSADDRYFAVSYGDQLRVYEKRNDAYVSVAVVTMPTSVSISYGGLSWTPDNSRIAVGLASSPFVAVYSFDGSALTLQTTSISVSSGVRDLKFSPNGKYLAITVNSSPFFKIYKHSAGVFTELTSSIPDSSAVVRAITWTGYSDYFVMQIAFQGRIWRVNNTTDVFTETTGSPFNLASDVYEYGSLTAFPARPVVKTPATGGVATVLTRLGVSAVSFDPSDLQVYQPGNAAPRLGSTSATSSTGWTLIQNANVDDGFSGAISLPFNTTIAGVSATSVFVSSNGYLTFGSGSGDYSSDASWPEIEKLLIAPGDYSYQRVYAKVEADYALIRYEGYHLYQGTTPGNSNIVWEVAVTKPNSSTGKQVIEVRIGAHEGIDTQYYATDELMLASATTSLSSTVAVKNTTYILEGNANGTAWTLTSGSYLLAI